MDVVYDEIHQEVEQHLRDCDALMANMDGWENEMKQQLKIATVTCKDNFVIHDMMLL